MPEYLIYGKHTKPYKDEKNKWHEPDKTFRALDANGVRVNRLDEAMSYATYEDAEERINKPRTKARVDRGEVAFQIRRAY